MRTDTIVILGGHIQALGLARQAKSSQLKVILVLADGFSVARFSNCVDYVYICKERVTLLDKLRKLAGQNVMLFPTSDDYINFIIENYTELNSLFYVALPAPGVVELFADKRNTYKFAEANNIYHPQSYYPTSIEEVHEIADKLTYPQVIKPAVMYSFHKQFGRKAFLCANSDELIDITNKISQTYPVDGLVIQEFMSGGAKNLYSYGVFAIEGEVKVSIMANRIRQNPMDFGNSTTFAITCDIPEIEKAAKHIIKLTNYTGMGEIEFMYDKGKYKFLEINTRAWKWHTLSEGRNFGFLSEWIAWLNGEPLTVPNDKEIAWVERLTDSAVVVKELFKGKLSLKEVFQSYNNNKIVFGVWNLHDPLPAIMYVLQSPILYFKRH